MEISRVGDRVGDIVELLNLTVALHLLLELRLAYHLLQLVLKRVVVSLVPPEKEVARLLNSVDVTGVLTQSPRKPS